MSLSILKIHMKKVRHEQPALFDSFFQPVYANYSTVRELQSDKFPILQLADLFAGLVRTSRKEEAFYNWFKEQGDNQQPSLFPIDRVSKVTNSMRPKFEVMRYFKDQASKYSLGINLSKEKYFMTFNKKNNIMILHYKPQHLKDKAPVRN